MQRHAGGTGQEQLVRLPVAHDGLQAMLDDIAAL